MKRFAARLRRVLLLATLMALQTGMARGQSEAADRRQPYPVPALLGLSDAIEIALAGSTRLGTQQAQLDASRKQRLNSIFSLGPDLIINGVRTSQTRTDLDVPVFVGSDSTVDITEKSSFRNASATSSVRLFDGLANYFRIAAANDDVRADELDLAYTATQVQTTVIEAYYTLLRAQLLLNVALEAESVSREELERTQALYELGSAARSDVLKSQVQLGNQRLNLVQARNSVRQGYDGLVYAMNLLSATRFAIDTTIATIPDEEFEFEEEIDFAHQQRLDLQSLRAAEAAESDRVVVARGPLFPSVDFSYNFNVEDSDSQFRFGASNRARSRRWTLSANWNVFDRFLTYSSISSAKAQRRIAEYNRRQAELDAIREIRDFLNQLREARERQQVARENVDRAEEDLRLATEKFRVGAGTILDRISAESDLTSTKAEEVQAIVDYLIARAKLYRATGRPLSDL